MRWLRKIKPIWPLRLGLGVMYLYSGFDLVNNPSGWLWAIRPLPQGVQDFISSQIGTELYLRGQGVGEIIIGLIFLAWFLPPVLLRLASFLGAVQMALILWLVGVSLDTFRDIGLLGGLVGLFLLSSSRYYD